MEAEAVAVGKVQADGQIMLPTEVRQAAGIEPGDLLSVDVTAGGTVEIRRLTPKIQKLTPLRLADLLERYHIDEPIDEARIREEWQDIAAREVFGAEDRERR